MKVLVAGDYCDANRVSDKIKEGQYGFLFDDVKPIIEEADYSFVNFEFPIVINEGEPIPKCGPNLKGQEKSIDAIRYAGFNACTLANNHILDQGEKSCIDTKRLLEDVGINTVGAGKNLGEASEILYLKKDEEVLAVINCCEHEFSISTETSAGANPLNPIQQFYKIQEAKKNTDYVLVIVHGGHEHYQLPSPRMKETYRFFIDAGADAVVNHHQHCYSGYEVYKEKPIFYGLGNFLFDDINLRKSIWNEGYMVNIRFNKTTFPTFNLLPYTQCNDEPKIVFMKGESEKQFFNTISSLNSTIADDYKLKVAHEEMKKKYAKGYQCLLQPYSFRMDKGLYKRGYLPSLISQKKKYQILNYLQCEAHLERLIYALKKL